MGIKHTGGLDGKFNRDYFGGEYVSGKYVGQYTEQFGDATPGVKIGHTATGGLISEFTIGTDVYRSHIFNQSDTFKVTVIGTYNNKVDVLVVGGGGGGGVCDGGDGGGGGGGGGGVIFMKDQTITTVPGSYPITVGGGGVSAPTSSSNGQPGHLSRMYFPFPGVSPTPKIEVVGGGNGGSTDDSNALDTTFASGGGAGSDGGNDTGGASTGATSPAPTAVDQESPPVGWGNDGGDNSTGSSGAGGGGAGAAGGDAGSPQAGAGGAGMQFTMYDGSSKYYGGGGGGGAYSGNSNPAGAGGAGGGAPGGKGNPFDFPGQTPLSPTKPGEGPINGLENTGGGGGGGGFQQPNAYRRGGNGGSGVVIVRYQIGTHETQNAAGTGGRITFSPTKTIHTFQYSGTFTLPNSQSPKACEVIIGGGGGGGGWSETPWQGARGGWSAGGGGSGGGIYNSNYTITAGTTCPVTIGAGGKGSYFPSFNNGYRGTATGFVNPAGPYSHAAGGGGGGGTPPRGNNNSRSGDGGGDPGVSGGSGGGTGGYMTTNYAGGNQPVPSDNTGQAWVGYANPGGHTATFDNKKGAGGGGGWGGAGTPGYNFGGGSGGNAQPFPNIPADSAGRAGGGSTPGPDHICNLGHGGRGSDIDSPWGNNPSGRTGLYHGDDGYPAMSYGGNGGAKLAGGGQGGGGIVVIAYDT